MTDRNHKTEPCGCALVYLASVPTRPQGWYYTHRCEEHEEQK